ncbi:enoyl-CoA hydratase/isomerase family protein [Undibacterium sp.]|jgi:enoyl-CoA hydratase|uniref:enoyl-CoA hydratase/isomerase family protein n=1 Tax=Undibacterium sp. TaxID=1914977 RepID=UPI002C558B39|nr:enoyl-CoA hydratase-related protein [Undibacterium sp.]HTD05407.1 enoyl-CoA hydratase-related protein [Undibacterium sp.]
MSEIRCDKNGAIATVTLSNPGKLNALDLAMWQGLRSSFEALSADTELRCIIVTGDNGNFAAGADIQEFATVRNNLADGMRYHTETIAQALQAISNCLHPTIAAIEGVCVGGGLEIACACDMRIASAAARFGIPINRLGFPLAPGELQGLLDLVGKASALEILLEGRVFDAAEARDKGLINRIADDAGADAQQSAQRIARGAPLAARMNKQLIRRLSIAAEPLTEQELQQAFAFLESLDYREGVSSFLQKTPPTFTGQ